MERGFPLGSSYRSLRTGIRASHLPFSEKNIIVGDSKRELAMTLNLLLFVSKRSTLGKREPMGKLSHSPANLVA
jgi:hypothetical protein